MRLKIASMTSILCLTGLFLMAADAGAQFLQYTPPGGPTENPESRQEQLDRELRAARYRLGPVRIAPWATLRDLAYVRSVFVSGGQQLPNDVTATAGVGFRAYLRNGAKAVWTLEALPEYVWWQREPARRQLNGRYQLVFSGFFNHLTLEVKGGRVQQLQLLTPEVPTPVSARRDGGEATAELRLSGALSLFGAASIERQNSLVAELRDPLTDSLRLLDREERVTRGGVRWRPTASWSVGLGAERSEADFENRGVLDRSNSGTAPVAELGFQGRRVRFQAGAAARSLTARQGSSFVPYDRVTGNASLTLGTEGHLGVTLYANRDLVYSLSALYPYFEDQRAGVSLRAGLGARTQASLFAEGGRNSYIPLSPSTPGRRDDVLSYGASLAVRVRGGLSLGLQGLHSTFDSDVPGGDRAYTSVGVTINLLGFQ